MVIHLEQDLGRLRGEFAVRKRGSNNYSGRSLISHNLQEEVLIPVGLGAALGARLVFLGRLVHLDDHIGIMGIPQAFALDDLHKESAAGDHVLRVPQSHAAQMMLHVVLCGLEEDNHHAMSDREER